MDIYRYCDCLFACFVFQCSYFNLSYELIFSDHLLLEESGNRVFDLSNIVLINRRYKFEIDTSFDFPEKEEFDFMVFEVDLFDCFWTPYYKLLHTLHFFTVIGKNKNSWNGADPYFGKYSFEISKEWLCRYVKSYLIARIRDIQLENDIKIILRYLEKRLRTNNNSIKKALVDLILDAGNHVEKYLDNNYMGIPAIRRLKRIADSRMCYLKVLEYIEKEYKVEVKEEKEDIEQIVISLNRIKLLVLKNIMKNTINLNGIIFEKKVDEWLRLEEKMIQNIVKKVRNIDYVE